MAAFLSAPYYRRIRTAIECQLPVQTVPVAKLGAYGGRFDLRRFSRYRQVAERYAMGQRLLFEE